VLAGDAYKRAKARVGVPTTPGERSTRRRQVRDWYTDDEHIVVGGGQFAQQASARRGERDLPARAPQQDALLLGRSTYEVFSAAYPAMSGGDSEVFSQFIARMNSIPKYVASTTLHETTWNATVIDGDVASFVTDLKQRPGGNIIKYGNGPLDVTLMEHGLIDEFHLLLTPVALGKGQHLFEDIESAPSLNLIDVTRHSNGVVILTYTPK
jgi:dihydrofolate reductase